MRERRVYATGAVRKHERYARYGDIDTAAIVLTMDDGVLVTIDGTRHDPLGQDIRVEIASGARPRPPRPPGQRGLRGRGRGGHLGPDPAARARRLDACAPWRATAPARRGCRSPPERQSGVTSAERASSREG